jgi:hypothetical protein
MGPNFGVFHVCSAPYLDGSYALKTTRVPRRLRAQKSPPLTEVNDGRGVSPAELVGVYLQSLNDQAVIEPAWL